MAYQRMSFDAPNTHNMPRHAPGAKRVEKPRPTHWVVRFDNPDSPSRCPARPAIPFTLFDPAYSLAKRATRENHPAQAIEVYEKDGQFYDANGNAVRVRGVA